MNELNQIIGMVPNILRALPTLLAYIVIVKLAYAHIMGWRNQISAVDAAYTLVALAAFSYAVR